MVSAEPPSGAPVAAAVTITGPFNAQFPDIFSENVIKF